MTPGDAASAEKLAAFYGEMSPSVETVRKSLEIAGIDPDRARARDLYERDIDVRDRRTGPVRGRSLRYFLRMRNVVLDGPERRDSRRATGIPLLDAYIATLRDLGGRTGALIAERMR